MAKEVNLEDSQKIETISFMVEVVKQGKNQKHFTVRVPAPDGSARIACFGFLKEFNQFIDSL